MRQVRGLGYQPGDVPHVVLTHLDVDHTGGLHDIPHATLHVMDAEYGAATATSSHHPEHTTSSCASTVTRSRCSRRTTRGRTAG